MVKQQPLKGTFTEGRRVLYLASCEGFDDIGQWKERLVDAPPPGHGETNLSLVIVVQLREPDLRQKVRQLASGQGESAAYVSNELVERSPAGASRSGQDPSRRCCE